MHSSWGCTPPGHIHPWPHSPSVHTCTSTPHLLFYCPHAPSTVYTPCPNTPFISKTCDLCQRMWNVWVSIQIIELLRNSDSIFPLFTCNSPMPLDNLIFYFKVRSELNLHIVPLLSYIHCVFLCFFFLCISCKENSLIWDLNQERSKWCELLFSQNRSYDITSSSEYAKSTQSDMSQVWINGIDKLTRIVT